MATGLPSPQGLYDPSHEHDSCGVGFIVDLKGRKSHQLVRDGLQALVNLNHRGACGCENNTGDGAGILIQIPHEFLSERCKPLGIDPARARQLRRRARSSPRRTRPSRPSAWRSSRRSSPRKDRSSWAGVRLADRQRAAGRGRPGPSSRRMFHALLGRGPRVQDADAFERKLYVIRKRFRNRDRGHPGSTITSTSTSPACRAGPWSTRECSRPARLRSTSPTTWATRCWSSAICMFHSRFSHQHLPELAAGPPLSDDLAQRRDQHAARQHQLDAGPRGPLRLASFTSRATREAQADHPRGPLRHGLPGQCHRASGPARATACRTP